MIGRVTYSYTPKSWNQDDFIAGGGFSVVFLNYNKLPYIENSVASALDQDFDGPIEYFFMDDASTDGSGDRMEAIVRQYIGRHKVTVIRNTENQHIAGQWNIVSKMATGNWLGFCTGVDGRDAKTGEVVSVSSREYISYSKGDGIWDIVLMKTPIIGASAWWHRSLFVRPLRKAPLDDVHLRWVLESSCRNDTNPVWIYDGTVATVYSWIWYNQYFKCRSA